MVARRSPIQNVEAFHLAFLRALGTKLDRASYVVKGGVNLRAWFGSARYSEDLDLDLVGTERTHLADRVDQILAGPPLSLLLDAQGLDLVRISKPKQTDTTQRWKFEILARSEGLPIHTKVEFSRRGLHDEHVYEPVLAAVVRPYGMPAPAANHYTAAAAVRQKVRALAGRTTPQARDVWDLDHLLRTRPDSLRPLGPELKESAQAAVERVMEMPFDRFKAQVVPYIEAEYQALYESPEAWERMRELVVAELLRLGT
jgi:predicted nucleotidyltransferase component of viral defense system